MRKRLISSWNTGAVLMLLLAFLPLPWQAAQAQQFFVSRNPQTTHVRTGATMRSRMAHIAAAQKKSLAATHVQLQNEMTAKNKQRAADRAARNAKRKTALAARRVSRTAQNTTQNTTQRTTTTRAANHVVNTPSATAPAVTSAPAAAATSPATDNTAIYNTPGAAPTHTPIFLH